MVAFFCLHRYSTCHKRGVDLLHLLRGGIETFWEVVNIVGLSGRLLRGLTYRMYPWIHPWIIPMDIYIYIYMYAWIYPGCLVRDMDFWTKSGCLLGVASTLPSGSEPGVIIMACRIC